MLGKGSLKAEPNYFNSLALNIFAQYLHLSFLFSLCYHEIKFNSKVNFSTLLFLVSLSIIKDGIFNKTVPLLLRE